MVKMVVSDGDDEIFPGQGVKFDLGSLMQVPDDRDPEDIRYFKWVQVGGYDVREEAEYELVQDGPAKGEKVF